MKTVDLPAAYKFGSVSLDLALEIRRTDGLIHRRPQGLSQSSKLWDERRRNQKETENIIMFMSICEQHKIDW